MTKGGDAELGPAQPSFGIKVERLVRSPLGIIGLCLVLGFGLLIYVSRSGSLGPDVQRLLILGSGGFILVVFFGFVYVLVRHPGKLLNPKAFRTDKGYLEAIQLRAAVPVVAPPDIWKNPTIYEGEALPGGEITGTTVMTLFDALRGTRGEWVYFVVDIEDGERWLLSRLFIFALLLKQVRDVRCFVFVQTTSAQKRQFLGLAAPSTVRLALGRRYPWFDDALRNAWESIGSPVLADEISLEQAQRILEAFVFNEKIQVYSERQPSPEWSALREDFWDHSSRLDLRLFNQDLAAVCYPPGESTVRRERGESGRAFFGKLLRCRAPFIALVNNRNEFQELYDEQAVRSRAADGIQAAM